MASVSRDEVRRIAGLARIRVSEGETEALGRELGSVLEYVALLDALDTRGVEPTSTVIPLATPLREDEARAALAPSEVVRNAPAHEGSAFAVPKVLGSDAEG